MVIENLDVKPADASSVSADANPAASSPASSDTSSTPASDATPAPSTGESAAPPVAKTPLDVVRNVLTVKPATTEAEKKPDAQASTPDATTPTAAADGKLPPLTPEEEAKLPFHKHPRWQEVLKDRDTARVRAAELEEPARQFGMVQDFMSKNSLTPPEMADGFTVMALMRNDPGKAIPVLEDYLDQLKLITGQKLPDDLQSQVDSGAMTDAAAKELATSRLKIATTTAESTRNAEAANATASQIARQNNATAVNAWEVQTRSADPDYDRKRPFIKDSILAQTAALGTKPPTAAEAVAIAKRAYDSVTERFKGLGPRQQTPTPPQPRSGDSTSPRAGNVAAPKTPLEAAKRGLGMA